MFAFCFYTVRGDFKFVINEETEFTSVVYSQLIAIFSDVDAKNHIFYFSIKQKMTDELRDKINLWISEYETINVQLKKVKHFVDSIKNDEIFFVFPKKDFSVEEIFKLFQYLKVLNQGINEDLINDQIEKIKKTYEELFKEIFEKYSVLVCNTKKKTIYGERDKQQRRCIYCGKTMKDGAQFNNIAHAISEALGNKTIISAEECDTCNARFAECIEKDIIEYLHLFRTLFGKKGKNGVPHLKYRDGIDINYDDGNAVIYAPIGTGVDINDSFTIPLKFIDPLNFMNVYRALVKFVIGVAPKESICHLSKTIDWINNIKNDGSKLNLPPIAILLDNQNFFDQPELSVYTRKKDVDDLPYMYAEFKSTFFTFVYIIPFSDNDCIDYSQKEHYDKFWKFNKHYLLRDDWEYVDFNIDKDVMVTMNCNFNLKGNNVVD